ncbi:MAG: hypothetical protein IJ608_08035 [Lachnospiraceae bacterium]|nr:hypothetical protein [Lachnospiraceae bacterium]
MNKKTTGIVSYITLIGWLIAFFAGDKEGAKFHLNQSLVLWICNLVLTIITNIVGNFGTVGAILSIVCLVCSIALFVFWIIGLVRACKEDETPLPIIGGIQILK